MCVVSGSTAGIGLETARLLVAEGARVVTCGRSAAPGIGEALHVVGRPLRAGRSEGDDRAGGSGAPGGSTFSSTTSASRCRRGSRRFRTRTGTRCGS